MNKLTKEQIEEIIKSDYEGKPYALIIAVTLGFVVFVIACAYLLAALGNIIYSLFAF